MKTTLRRRRAALVAATAALLLAGSGALSTSSAASATLWTFKNQANGKCLTASSTGRVWVASCNGSSSQRWDWVGPTNDWLKNAATGQCLTTDYETHRNAVWTTTCRESSAERWMYYSNSLFTYPAGTDLRTSPSGSAAVYTVDAWDDAPLSYSTWTGSHT